MVFALILVPQGAALAQTTGAAQGLRLLAGIPDSEGSGNYPVTLYQATSDQRLKTERLVVPFPNFDGALFAVRDCVFR